MTNSCKQCRMERPYHRMDCTDRTRATDDLLVRIAELEGERDTLLRVLKDVEWCGETHQSDVVYCNCCGAEATLDPETLNPVGEHEPDCALRAALEE